MKEKARINSLSKVMKEGLNTEFIIPESDFWKIFNSYNKSIVVKISKRCLKKLKI